MRAGRGGTSLATERSLGGWRSRGLLLCPLGAQAGAYAPVLVCWYVGCLLVAREHGRARSGPKVVAQRRTCAREVAPAQPPQYKELFDQVT